NLNSINVELLPDADLEAFLERAQDRVERFLRRKMNDLIPPEQAERLHQFKVAQTLSNELGCFLTFEEVLEIVRTAKAADIERMEGARAANLTSSESVQQ